jgi:thiamine biosynthesis lipoprotein
MACTQAPDCEAPPLVHAEPVMGTVVSFRLPPLCGVPPETAWSLVEAACRLLHRLDASLSTWRADSALSRLRRGELALVDGPEELRSVLDRCDEAKALSGGWFDPWAMPGGVDPTGLVKGWAVDRVADLLRDGGVEAFLLNAGGDLRAVGAPSAGQAWRVGVRHPWDPAKLAAVVSLEAAIATSGPYERGPHLVDPSSGTPRARAASASVAAPELAVADALATGMAVGGDAAFDAMSRSTPFELYLIRPDGSERSTRRFPFIDEA